MELRIDPNFLPAFERLRKGFRKKSAQVRDELARAGRSGHGLPQTDKLTLAWKQHRRAVFWVRVDRAIRLMYEQEGDVQTVLFVGKHQEAESFLRNLPKKCSAEEAISVATWLETTAPPAAELRIDKTEKERKPATTHSAQRQLIQALENLFVDCLLNVGPAVVEEYTAPRVVELEGRLSHLRENMVEADQHERRERERTDSRLEESLARLIRVDKAMQAMRSEFATVAEQAERLQSSLADAIDELRRERQMSDEETRRATLSELASIRESQRQDAAQQLDHLRSVEQRITETRHSAQEATQTLSRELDRIAQECFRQILTETEKRHQEQQDHAQGVSAQLHTLQEKIAAQHSQLADATRRNQELAQRLAILEEKLIAAESSPGWLDAILPKWLWR